MSSLENWKGSTPIFVIELYWAGVMYNLSTEPVDCPTGSGYITYIGGIEEAPTFEQQIKEGFSLDSLFVSVACQIGNVDISAAILSGRYLENATAELSMLLVKNGEVLPHDQRVKLFRGFVSQPVFGHIDKSQSYVEFSIESDVFDASVYALLVDTFGRCSSLDASAVNSPITSPLSPILDAFNHIQTFEPHRGKQIPFVFGKSGRVPDQRTGLNYDFPSTPAYVLSRNAATDEIYILIAAHPVLDTAVKLHDNNGNSVLITGGYGNVEQFVMSNGRVFSYIIWDLTSPLLSNVNTDNSVQYWISWRDGAFISPSENGVLESGGDLCLWLLQQGNADIDYGSWESVRGFLNAYKFGGYIKASDETPIEFLEKNILPFLPISIVNSYEGLRAVPDLLNEGIPIKIDHTITANPEFYRISPVSTLTDPNDIINSYSLEYSLDGCRNIYRSIMRLRPDQSRYTNYTFSNLYAEVSKQRFGEKQLIEEAPYIYSDATAALVCKDKIKKLAFPKRETVYLTSPRYGYIQIGDIISLTDESLGITSKKAQVTKKVFKDTNWEYTITLNDHTIQEIEQ